MTTKIGIHLNEALTMSPEQRDRIARCLIQSLESLLTENIDDQWVQLSQKRLEEMENGIVEPVSWEELKKS